MVNTERIEELFKEIESGVFDFKADSDSVHAFDVKELLLEVRDLDIDKYISLLKRFPSNQLAEVIAELPDHLQEEASESLGIKKLVRIASNMDTDDAADFLQNISDVDSQKAEKILDKINVDDQEKIRNLISYDDEVAGSFMQSELFKANESELVAQTISRLREVKIQDKSVEITKIFVLTDSNEFVCTIGLEELVLFSDKMSIKELASEEHVKTSSISSNHLEDIREVVEKVCDYNISVLPIVDEEGILVGRITSDDIYDLIQNRATDEMFHLAGLNPETEQGESLIDSAKSRGGWLLINLITAIGASCVVSYFDATITSFVSLAILMPIVASMGGNAGTQSLTVTIRRISTGELTYKNSVATIKKEIILSLINGLVFSLIIGFVASYWFNIPWLGVVIGLSTIVSLLTAGFSGAVTPIILEKLNIDPAIASSVILTTITDMMGFFSFLWLAKELL
jgi:magnesium transporter